MVYQCRMDLTVESYFVYIVLYFTRSLIILLNFMTFSPNFGKSGVIFKR